MEFKYISVTPWAPLKVWWYTIVWNVVVCLLRELPKKGWNSMTLKISTWSYNVYAKNKLIILEFKQATTKAEVGNNSFKNETVMFGMC